MAQLKPIHGLMSFGQHMLFEFLQAEQWGEPCCQRILTRPFKVGNYQLNSLNFQQQQVSFILGHSLRSLYEDVLNAPIPDNLLALAAQLEPKTHVEARTGDELLPEQPQS
jgi:hypothetical protein